MSSTETETETEETTTDDKGSGSRDVRRREDYGVLRLRKKKKHWRAYGIHKVFLNGIIIIGPVRSWWWLLQGLHVIVGITFILERDNYLLPVWISGLILLKITLLSSFKTLFLDPGIIKKPTYEQAQMNAREAYELMRRKGTYGVTKDLEYKGILQQHTYCFKCHIFKPPDADHCYTCSCCLEEMDHHCPIFGGCVARKNKISFFIMCISSSFLYVFWLIASAFVAANRFEKGAASWYDASAVLNEILLAILLSCILPPLLTLYCPCEKRKGNEFPSSSDSSLS